MPSHSPPSDIGFTVHSGPDGVVGMDRWREHDHGFVVPGHEAHVIKGGREAEALGGGMLRPDTSRRKGFDPSAVSGYAWGLGLEVLAMLRFDLDDVRKLWPPPYVPK